MENSVIIGYGYVGQATASAFGITNHYSRSNKTVERKDLHNFKYVYLCLPTPTKNGACDTSLIKEYVKDISEKNKEAIFIVRSTVIPGTCNKLSEKYKVKIVHVPEFLSEETWKEDSNWPDITVIGADDKELLDDVAGIFKMRYKGSQFVLTDLVTSEFIKYAINTFYATKVIFANELYDYAIKNGINYETVKEAMYSRKWIGKNHLDIWHKGGRGAGGACLFKDLDSFSHETKSPLLMVANNINKELVIKYPKDERTSK